MATNEPLVLRPHGAVPAETTSPLGDVTETPAPPASTTPNPVKVIRTSRNLTHCPLFPLENPNKKRPIFHEALVKLQKQLLATLGVKPDDWDDEDEINDNDIITVSRLGDRIIWKSRYSESIWTTRMRRTWRSRTTNGRRRVNRRS